MHPPSRIAKQLAHTAYHSALPIGEFYRVEEYIYEVTFPQLSALAQEVVILDTPVCVVVLR